MSVHICMHIMYVQYLHMHRKMYAFGKRWILEESKQIVFHLYCSNFLQ